MKEYLSQADEINSIHPYVAHNTEGHSTPYLYSFLNAFSVFENCFHEYFCIYFGFSIALYRPYSLVTKIALHCDKSHSLSYINKILISYIFTYFIIYRFGLK